MSGKTATKQLREMLDERGVAYETNDDMGASETRWNGFTAYQLTPNAKLVMYPTPEQAIAATLGALPDRHPYEQRIEELERLWHAFENEVAAQSVEIAERDKRIAELEAELWREGGGAMSGYRTTELLREGLTEHGIEWRSGLKGVTFVGDWCFVEYDNGKLAATCEPVLTPEQAIAATLGVLHDNPYVGLVRGKQWERHEMSDYYCGRCGWKVTDHDSYCPECGARVIETGGDGE